MVVADDVFIGVAQVDNDAVGLAVVSAGGEGRRGEAGAAVGVVAQVYASQGGVRGETALQLIAQVAGEEQAEEGGTIGELLREAGYGAVGAVGVEEHVVRIRQALGQTGDFRRVVVGMIGREGPDVVAVQIGDAFVPVGAGVDDGRSAGQVGVDPLRGGDSGVGSAINADEGDGVEGGCNEYDRQRGDGGRVGVAADKAAGGGSGVSK